MPEQQPSSNPSVSQSPNSSSAPSFVQTTPTGVSTTTVQVPEQPLNKDASERIWGALSYIPMLGLLALMVKPNSAYIKLHGRQGVLLFAMLIASLIASIFLYIILPAGLVLALWSLVQLGIFVISVYSAYLAFMGHWWKIPTLGDLSEKIPVEFFTKVATEAITGQQVSSSQDSSQSNNTVPLGTNEGPKGTPPSV